MAGCLESWQGVGPWPSKMGLLGSGFPLQCISAPHCFRGPPSIPSLTSVPDSPQPWFIAPWQSCCSASLLPSPCCCCGSWDLVYCGPCWVSWGPWPWALFVGMHCYTCCHMYVKPLPCSLPPVMDSLRVPRVLPVTGCPLPLPVSSHTSLPTSASAHSCLPAASEGLPGPTQEGDVVGVQGFLGSALTLFPSGTRRTAHWI